MVCQVCGAMSQPGHKFCKKCGTKLKEGSAAIPDHPVEGESSQNASTNETPLQEVKNVAVNPSVKEEMPQNDENVSFEDREVVATQTPVYEEAEVNPVEPMPKTQSKSTFIPADRAVTEGTSPKRKSKAGWIVSLELLFLIGAMVFAFFGLRTYYSPGKYASEFFVQLAGNNYSKAYKFLQVDKDDEDDFISDEMLKISQAYLEISNVKDYDVEGSYHNEDIEIGFETKEEGEKSASFSMIKSDKKKMLFFPEWKVDVNPLLSNNFRIHIPSEGFATVLVDGVKLGKEYLESEGEIWTYKIPKIFKGSHTVEVQLEDKTLIKERIKITKNRTEADYSEMNMRSVDLAGLHDKAVKSLERIYDSAVKSESMSNLNDLFTDNIWMKDFAGYNEAVSRFNNYDTAIKSIELIEIKTTLTDQPLSIKLDYRAKITFSKKEYKEGKNKWVEKVLVLPLTATFNYLEIDGQFLIDSYEFEDLKVIGKKLLLGVN